MMPAFGNPTEIFTDYDWTEHSLDGLHLPVILILFLNVQRKSGVVLISSRKTPFSPLGARPHRK